MSKFNRQSTLTRRHFLQWVVGLSVSAAAAASYVRVFEPRWLAVESFELAIKGLSPALDGKRIAQLSDIHLSEDLSPTRFAQAIDEVAKQAPDWLVMTGDYVTEDANLAEALVAPLRALTMPTYAIYGNHDLWSGQAIIRRHLEAANVNILLNSGQQIASNLYIAGIDDVWSGNPSLKSALSSVPRGMPTILLAHEPDYFDTVLYEEAPIALQLSGHSHGGQVRIPTLKREPSGHFSFAPILPRYGRRYPIGLRKINERYVYTNRGLGTAGPPVRLNCRPELTVITLRAA